MSSSDEIERIKAEARFLSLNPNALAASGLSVTVERAPYVASFGENGFIQVAARWYDAILPVLAQSRGLDVEALNENETRFMSQLRAA